MIREDQEYSDKSGKVKVKVYRIDECWLGDDFMYKKVCFEILAHPKKKLIGECRYLLWDTFGLNYDSNNKESK